jgi:hypothetical protein
MDDRTRAEMLVLRAFDARPVVHRSNALKQTADKVAEQSAEEVSAMLRFTANRTQSAEKILDEVVGQLSRGDLDPLFADGSENGERHQTKQRLVTELTTVGEDPEAHLTRADIQTIAQSVLNRILAFVSEHPDYDPKWEER